MNPNSKASLQEETERTKAQEIQGARPGTFPFPEFPSPSLSPSVATEWKHQNISAVLVQLGLPYVRGYRPRFNYQDLLRIVVEERLTGATGLFEAAEKVVEQTVAAPPVVRDILSILAPPPVRDDDPRTLRDMPRGVRRDTSTDDESSRCSNCFFEADRLRYASSQRVGLRPIGYQKFCALSRRFTISQTQHRDQAHFSVASTAQN